jgi:glutathione S-transferase
MIDLYMDQTPHGLRASVALEETGLPYRPHKVDLSNNEHLTAQFLSLNPSGAIPVLIDHDGPDGKKLTLTQSTAIIIYCAERTGTFIPQDPVRRALTLWHIDAGSGRRPRHQTRPPQADLKGLPGASADPTIPDLVAEAAQSTAMCQQKTHAPQHFWVA